MGGAKPHLLVATTNNMGAETRVEYAPSTRFYLADKRAGAPWPLPLPFPVHVVERIVVVDHISGNRYGTRFAYHYGYFDVVEREFRGFAKVDQWDSEAFAALDPAGAAPVAANLEASAQVPPAHTVTWFHTGQWERRAEFDAALARDYYGQPQLGEPVVPAGLTVDEEREARRALKARCCAARSTDWTAPAASRTLLGDRKRQHRALPATPGRQPARRLPHRASGDDHAALRTRAGRPSGPTRPDPRGRRPRQCRACGAGGVRAGHAGRRVAARGAGRAGRRACAARREPDDRTSQ
ncbi:insecticide toxin TcdB middle/N-terminal region family protein [Mycobacterium kansasii]|uniref:Insecticide toxin TcdB middle/N-terminal region family protein n=1 Tax=Mycobacterium kansasii TaxID=1768 RepID=A0A1V3XRL8_MYCKA|nr:insecticide toxin TcdB middle/N-terminal region family protein [Mycobacterium kansasii]